jgi:hypothetical protein
MRVTNNGKIYDAKPESIFSDISISANTLEEACAILESFESLSNYAFGLVPYANMVVSKRSIVVSNTIIVKIKLRKKTELELAQEEIAELRKALAELLKGSSGDDNSDGNTSSGISQLLDKWRL